MSLTPEILAALREGYVPATCLSGLLAGWVGPVVPPWATRWPLNTDWMLPWFLTHRAGMMEGGDDWALPLARPEVRLRVASRLAAGERCLACDGTGTDGDADPDARAAGYVESPLPRGTPCRLCGGSGWSRKPAPIWHLLPASEVGPGGLPPEDAQYAPELVACSVVRVLVGMESVRSVLRRSNPLTPYFYVLVSGHPDFLRPPAEGAWRTDGVGGFTFHGLTPPEDAAVLDVTGLHAPWPEGA